MELNRRRAKSRVDTVRATVWRSLPLRVVRSISIFDGKSGELVWDSGDFIETFIANEKNGFSGIFNSNGGERRKQIGLEVHV